MKKLALIFIVALLPSISFGACPNADLTDDCKVNLKDFAVLASGWLATYSDTDLYNMASGWLTQGIPDDPAIMAWVAINDPGISGHEGFNGEMSKYETTNAQYCLFLNAALASGDIAFDVTDPNIVVGANGANSGADFLGEIYFMTYNENSSTLSKSQISFDGNTFSVRTRKDINNNDINMSNHPIAMVSWYGATAFCNYYGYRLPTEWEWLAVADYDGSYNYGCGATIDSTMANFSANNPLDLLNPPYTTPIDHYPSYGYGMNDMAGNNWEWTSSLLSPALSYRILRGGCWNNYDNYCSFLVGDFNSPSNTYFGNGFRVCR